MATPWWDYNRIDAFGTIDPQGPYWKPDSNIQVPGNYPVTALLPGTVTNVERTSWGQTVVTVKLDTPLNSLATHTFYEHLSGATVSQGQRVNQGDLIGYNNPPGSVPLGFGLYPGDVYGYGPGWNQLQNDLKPGGAGLLNPTNLLNAARGGQNVVTSTATTTTTTGFDPFGIGNAIGSAIQAWWTGVTQTLAGPLGWIVKPVRVLKFVGGVVLAGIAGFALFSGSPIVSAGVDAKAAGALGGINPHVLFGTAVIVILPFLHAMVDPAFNNRAKLTKIMVGGAGVMLVLSIVDGLGGRTIASALATLAVVAAIVADIDFFSVLAAKLGGH